MMTDVPARFDHLTIGASDLAASLAFYDAAFAPLGLVRVHELVDEEDRMLGLALQRDCRAKCQVDRRDDHVGIGLGEFAGFRIGGGEPRLAAVEGRPDRTLLVDSSFGLGFMRPSQTFFVPKAARETAFGHTGAGGSIGLGDPDAGLVKLSRRDLAPASALGSSGATTVAATVALAHAGGIAVFATGGLGGVHRGARDSWDVSADLGVLADTPMLVVCSGVKSILDIGATLELLETESVPVLGYQTDLFPAFYLRESPFPVPWRVDTPEQAAAVFLAHRDSSAGSTAVVLANPVPAEFEMDHGLHDRLLAEGLYWAETQHIRGKEVTPALLAHFHAGSGGASLAANEALVVANATLAAQLANVLAVSPR